MTSSPNFLTLKHADHFNRQGKLTSDITEVLWYRYPYYEITCKPVLLIIYSIFIVNILKCFDLKILYLFCLSGISADMCWSI